MKNILFLILLIVAASCFNSDKNNTDNTIQQIKNIAFQFPLHSNKNEQQELIDKCVKSISANKDLINEDSFNDSITISFVTSKDEMEKVAGMRASGLAFPERKIMYSLFDIKVAPIKHELMHMVAMLKWGEPHPTSTWMNEGLATYAENNCNSFNVEEIYAYFLKTNKLISIDSLSSSFYHQPEMVAYHQSGYIVQYILDNYGKDNFSKLWQSGFAEFESIYKISFKQLLQNINEKVNIKYKEAPIINWELFKEGCK